MMCDNLVQHKKSSGNKLILWKGKSSTHDAPGIHQIGRNCCNKIKTKIKGPIF